MSYAVYQFYLNGGSDSIVIRVAPIGSRPVTFEVKTIECAILLLVAHVSSISRKLLPILTMKPGPVIQSIK
jgi:hypothetical protein